MADQKLTCARCQGSVAQALCQQCASRPDNPRRIYMQFFVRGVQGRDEWIVNFLEVDLKTSIGRIRTFRSEEKIWQTAERGGALKLQEDHQALEYAFRQGRGGLFLTLTAEQYGKLKR